MIPGKGKLRNTYWNNEGFFLCCIFRVVFSCCIFLCYFFLCGIKTFLFPQQIILIHDQQIFGQSRKKKCYIWVGKLGLIYYLVVLLCLFRNYLSLGKLNCLLIFLLFLLILSIYKWYCPTIFSIEFHFCRYYIIKFFCSHS